MCNYIQLYEVMIYDGYVAFLGNIAMVPYDELGADHGHGVGLDIHAIDTLDRHFVFENFRGK